MAIFEFNAAEVEPVSDYTPLPVGDYKAVIVESEMKATKAGTGQYLQLTYDIVDGEYKGRKLFDRLNLRNPNQQAVQIAQRTLSAICRAVGVMNLHDTAELHGKPIIIHVEIRPAKGEYAASNEIKKWSPIVPAGQNQFTPPPAQQTAPTQQQTESQIPGAQNAPW
jgi:hypothetical protein